MAEPSEGPKRLASETVAPPTSDTLGVLLVHGMGEQERGDTLLGFGEPIVKFLRRWLDTADGDTPFTGTDPFKSDVALRNVEATRVLGPDPNQPSNTTIAVAGHEASQWLLAESWWASDFKPATFTDVLNWGIRVIPIVLFDTVRYWSGRRNLANLGQLLFTLIIGPFLQATLLLLLPIAAVPFLRGIIGNLMVRLARSLGDPYLLLSSPIRLASMVERVHHDIRWLQDQGCTGIVVVAHSQGAAVAHHALRAFALGTYDFDREPNRKTPITRFITFGAAIEKLHFLHQIDIRGKNLLRGGVLQSAIALALLFSVLFAWRFPDWLSRIAWLRDRTWWDSAWNQGHWWTLGLWILLTVLFWAGPWLFQKPLRTDLVTYSEPKPDDLWNRMNLDKTAPRARWTDLYARADPVSLGPIVELTRENMDKPNPRSPLTNPDETSWEIRNQDSAFFDHTSYFDNTSQFVVPLIGGICMDSGLTDILDMRQPFFRAASVQRSRRVDWLNRAFAIIAATLLLSSVLLAWLDRLDDIGRPLKRVIEFLGDELSIPFEGIARSQTGDGRVAELVLGVIALLIFATLFHMLLIKGAWQAWDAGSIDRLLGQRRTLMELITTGVPGDQERLLGGFTDGAGRFLFFAALAPISAIVAILVMAVS